MDKYQETFKTWNKIASLYEARFMDLNIYDDTYDLFCKSLQKPQASILEIGCGPGNISKYLISKNPDLKIKGIDISENMIDLAQKNNPSAVFEVMDCRDVDQLTDTFDGIICGFCIPYLSRVDCLKLISDCKSLLNSAGVLYISFVDGDYDESRFLSGSSGDRTYFYYHPVSFVEDCLKARGFEMIALLNKNYPKPDGSEETHTIIISRV